MIATSRGRVPCSRFYGRLESRRKALAALLAMPIPAWTVDTAAATPVPRIGLPWSGLSRDDLDRMHAAAARLCEGRSIGTIERWRNPDSNDAGSVKLLQKFEGKGMPCSHIAYTVRLAEALRSAGTQRVRGRPGQDSLKWPRSWLL